MPSILFLTLKTFSATGGIEKFNRCFAKALTENGAEKGFECKVYAVYDRLPDERYTRQPHFRGFAGQKIAFAAAAIAAARNADIIIASHINLASLLETIRRLFPHKKRVLIAHGIEVWRPLSGMQTRALQHAHVLWSVSRFTAAKLQEKKLRPESIRIFHNTIDPFLEPAPEAARQQIRQQYGIADNEKLVLTVSRLAATEAQKGYDKVLMAMPAVVEQFPGSKYLLCGKADETEKLRLQALMDAQNLQAVVILAGFIPDAQLPACYSAADLFAMPSSKEGFGIVFIEAAMAGLPVLAGNKDGSADALLDGALGALVDPDDQQQITTAILQLLQHPLLPDNKIHRRQLVLSHFGFESFKQRQWALLKELL